MEELISVVIPSYNRESTILDCVNSVLNQTYKNIEVIVVDDCSQDDTYKLFENFSDERVSYYKYEPNQGACFARNYGADRAKGKYIAFQDSDDEWHPEKLEKQLDYLKKGDYDFVFCGMNRVDPEMDIHFYFPQTNFDENGDVLRQQLVESSMSTQTFFMKKEVFEKVRFDVSFKRFQDWDFSLQVVLAKFKVGYLNEALLNSIIQGNSISTNVKNTEAHHHLFEKYEQYYKQYPDALASIYRKMADSYRKTDRKKTKSYFKLSLKSQFDSKTFVKRVLYSLHLWT